ncbi:MAG TPA: class I tRNA ligase family protein, partial [Candidatus Limnocylindrales bacterium]|nr:class I tRNA ligase family protein [Candidatus Limnocylindrales bacterium]
RGNFLDPGDFVAAFGTDGARYVALREVPFDKDAEVSWDGFVRRYNADLANDFGNLVNRTVSMANRYLGGERPAPRSAEDAGQTFSWASRIPMLCDAIDGCLLHEALGVIWAFVGEANRYVDAEKPWELSKAAKTGDDAAAARLRLVLGDLVEACRVIALAAAPFLPGTAPRVLEQLGFAYPYAADGNGGPPLLDELRWAAHAEEHGTLTAAQPLFPRLDAETAAD